MANKKGHISKNTNCSLEASAAQVTYECKILSCGKRKINPCCLMVKAKEKAHFELSNDQLRHAIQQTYDKVQFITNI